MSANEPPLVRLTVAEYDALQEKLAAVTKERDAKQGMIELQQEQEIALTYRAEKAEAKLQEAMRVNAAWAKLESEIYERAKRRLMKDIEIAFGQAQGVLAAAPPPPEKPAIVKLREEDRA